MISTGIHFDKVEAFSAKDKLYKLSPEKFENFIQFQPTIDGLKEAIKERRSKPVNRALLVSELQNQYSPLGCSDAQTANIEALKDESTFTLITAHQPSLFTGPLYYIYKIFSIINLAEKLNDELPNAKLVPVFINGSEDHDFEEVNHCKIYGKTVEWNNDEGGAVGRRSLGGIQEAYEEFCQILGESENALKVKKLISSSMEGCNSYNQMVFKLVNALFAKYGVLVVNMDNKAFKQEFVPVMEKELFTRPSEALIEETQKQLETIGVKSQAFPREINLFYLQEGSRERIVFENGKYGVVNFDISWTEEELKTELHSNPNQFSPNVNLRPLYQEFTLPNIAYIGGGGEIAYWLERLSQFNHFDIFFPVLIRRKSMMIIPKSIGKVMDKLELSIDDIQHHEDQIINQYLSGTTEVEISLADQISAINAQLEIIENKATEADKSLKGFVGAENTRMLKQLDNIESRIKRSLKKQEETQIKQIKNLKAKLFPNNGLQERSDNFFQSYLTMGDELMETIKEMAYPLDEMVGVIIEN